MGFTLHTGAGDHNPHAQTIKAEDLVRRKEFCDGFGGSGPGEPGPADLSASTGTQKCRAASSGELPLFHH